MTSPQASERSTAAAYFDHWRPFWFGIPENWFEHIICVDLSGMWRRHLIWSKPAGNDLREVLTQRFSSTTVFVSLILGAEIGVLFSPSKPIDEMRESFKAQDYSLDYWAGIALALSIFFSIAALIANFTAWGIFSVIGDENLKLIARSSIGLYGAQLPNRLVVGVIYLFFLWVALFWWILMPRYTALSFSILGSVLLIHIVSTYSALGRIIMSTGAMSSHRILKKEIEEEMLPGRLADELLRRTKEARAAAVPVNLQYRSINIQASVVENRESAGPNNIDSIGTGVNADEITYR